MNRTSSTDQQALQYLAALSELIQEQLGLACADVTQTGLLLDDAIDQLNLSFQALGENLMAQPQAADVPSLVPHLHSAITGLQFHDMSNQLLQRIKIRLEDVQEIIANSLVVQEDHGPDWAQSQQRLAQQERAVLEQLRGSLRQTSVDVGDIELF